METPLITIFCKIVAIRDGQYLEMVVEDLNRNILDDLKYVTVVKLPNWNVAFTSKIGDIGYLQFESVRGGVTQWYNKELKDFETYNYSNNYFINFFKQQDICKQDKFEFE